MLVFSGNKPVKGGWGAWRGRLRFESAPNQKSIPVELWRAVCDRCKRNLRMRGS